MYDIFFLSYDENYADANFKKLKERFPYAKRIHGVKGIYQAHQTAAMQSFTKMFYVVDADAEVLDSFNFDHSPQKDEMNTVHVWHSINPVNDLEYGYGGIKLLPKSKFKNSFSDAVDISTGISDSFKVIAEVSNITKFNTTEFNAWRSAFRECAKLSSKIIDRSIDSETEYRLETWCTKGHDRLYGKYVIDGAIKGKEFGSKNFSDKKTLSLINNFEWLKQKFNET